MAHQSSNPSSISQEVFDAVKKTRLGEWPYYAAGYTNHLFSRMRDSSNIDFENPSSLVVETSSTGE
ncbi:MAG: hypothetical protein LQ341_006307 [Variospora aurantia]|nr:MAG: hypothetical protein LQ341_006307 [Variospora aurantia]